MTKIFLTALAGVLALILGHYLNARVHFLRRVCIPAPVTGGILISLLVLLLYGTTGITVDFDPTLKDICMMMFFTSVGLQSNLKVLRRGGRHIVVMVLLVALLIIFQNVIGIVGAKAMGKNPLLGMAVGSITMCGGHGTAGGFSDLLESMGLKGADSIAMAAATVGLLGGSLIGGPLAGHIISRRKLCEPSEVNLSSGKSDLLLQTSTSSAVETSSLFKAACEMFLTIGLGVGINIVLEKAGIEFPTYFGALVSGVIIRNVTELVPGSPKLAVDGIGCIGNISLALFLGMAMVSLRLWELAGIAVSMLLILLLQILFIALFARFVAFPLLGRDYDAAVLVSGICGFGLGATPNAMANMSSVSAKYRYSPTPFLVIPLVGALFVDILNITIISFFLNLL